MAWLHQSQQGEFEIIDSLGKDLSAILHCPVRFCAYQYDKPLFECKHDISFPKFAVQIAQDTGDWSQIIERHNEKDNE